jgi:hypothetical protein
LRVPVGFGRCATNTWRTGSQRPTGPEYTLTVLENKEYADVDDALAALVTATVSVNRAIEEDS